jgi:predicted transposase/invertase (TIGR01784 family)
LGSSGKERRVHDLHDRFFKGGLGTPGRIRDFLEGFLPSGILRTDGPDSIRILDSETIGMALDKSLKDRVVEVRMAEGNRPLHLLIEHKASPDPRVYFQMLRYMAALQCRTRKKGVPPVPVLPVVLYQGRRPWPFPGRFSGLFPEPPKVLETCLLDFSPVFIDLSAYSGEEIREKVKGAETLAWLLVMKHATKRHLDEFLEGIAGIGPGLDSDPEFFAFVLKYVCEVYLVKNATAAQEIADKLGGRKVMPTIIDKWMEEGMQKGFEKGMQKGLEQGLEQGLEKGMEKGLEKGMEKGVQQGIEKGREESQRNDIEKLLRKNILTPSQIASVLEVDLSRVEEILRSL